MELRNLITFMGVVELGSFTKAAEQLGYSQSTVSFQIKQLEDELGCLLFERINHTITLTEKGHELLSYAHRIRSLTEDFKESLEDEKEPTKITIDKKTGKKVKHKKIMNEDAYSAKTPMWVHIVLFLGWGWLMWRLWCWIEKH